MKQITQRFYNSINRIVNKYEGCDIVFIHNDEDDDSIEIQASYGSFLIRILSDEIELSPTCDFFDFEGLETCYKMVKDINKCIEKYGDTRFK